LGAPAVILLRIVRGDPASLLGHIAFWVSFIVLLSLIYYFLKKADPFQPETEKEERWEALSMWQARLKRGRFSKHSDPILWLIARTRSNGFSMTLLSSVVAILEFSVISAQNTFVASESSAWVAFLLFTLLAFVMARQCSSFLSESRENGMLEVLLVTPLSWEHLFKAQKTAFFSRITWPLGVIAAAEVAAELSLLTGDPTGRFRLVGLLVPFLTIGAYFLCREAILWTSLAFALRSRNAIHAAGKTMLTLVLIPGLATYILPFEKFTALFPYGDLLLVNLYYIAIYAGFAAWNRTHVRQQFRPEASGDPQPTSIPRKLLKLIPVAKG